MIKERDFTGDGKRAQKRLRRVLLMVDLLAPYRCWMNTSQIMEMLCERLGERLHHRTVYRDLRLLESLNMVQWRHEPNTAGGAEWQLNLRRSESLQTAAIKVLDS